MEFKDLEKKSENELKKILAEERGKLHDLRFKASVNQLRDVRKFKTTKKTIARILTRLKQLTYDR